MPWYVSTRLFDKAGTKLIHWFDVGCQAIVQKNGGCNHMAVCSDLFFASLDRSLTIVSFTTSARRRVAMREYLRVFLLDVVH